MDCSALTGCITCCPPSVHPPSKEQEFLGRFGALHLAAMQAGPSGHHLRNGFVHDNTQQRDFSPVDCNSAWRRDPRCWFHEHSHLLAAGSRGTELSVLIRNEWETPSPACPLSSAAAGQLSSAGERCRPLNRLSARRTSASPKDF